MWSKREFKVTARYFHLSNWKNSVAIGWEGAPGVGFCVVWENKAEEDQLADQPWTSEARHIHLEAFAYRKYLKLWNWMATQDNKVEKQSKVLKIKEEWFSWLIELAKSGKYTKLQPVTSTSSLGIFSPSQKINSRSVVLFKVKSPKFCLIGSWGAWFPVTHSNSPF